jgi:hypothetical protein
MWRYRRVNANPAAAPQLTEQPQKVTLPAANFHHWAIGQLVPVDNARRHLIDKGAIGGREVQREAILLVIANLFWLEAKISHIPAFVTKGQLDRPRGRTIGFSLAIPQDPILHRHIIQLKERSITRLTADRTNFVVCC